MSVTFCLGNIGIKRRAFRTPETGAVSIDNDDVLLSFRLDEKLYCAIGSLPFSDFSVREYMAYVRSLRSPRPLGDGEIRYLLRAVGFRRGLYTRVGALSRVEYRHLCLAARMEIDTRVVRLNFDGLPFSRRHRRQLLYLLRTLDPRYETLVAVTDTRFIPHLARTVLYTEAGQKPVSGRKALSRPACKSALLRRFRGNFPLGCDRVKKLLRLSEAT